MASSIIITFDRRKVEREIRRGGTLCDNSGKTGKDA